MADLTGLVTGLANGLNSYLGKKQDVEGQMALKAAPGPDTGTDQSDPVLSPEMAEKVLPDFGAQMVQKYNQENPNAPLKLSQGVAYLKTATDALEIKNKPQTPSKYYMGNDPNGNAIFGDKNGNMTSPDGSIYSGKVLPKSSNMPTSSTRSSGEFASTLLPHIQEMRNMINEADAKGYIGPTSGRIYNQFMAGKIGSTGNDDADMLLGRLRATDSLLKTGAMRVHFGARGGSNMYEHFSELLNTGKQSKAMLNGSLDGIEKFMGGYANAGKPQGASSTITPSPEENSSSDGWSVVK